MGRDDIVSPQAVFNLIAKGHVIVIFQESVLKLDGWLERHPGGRLAILHMVGKDATDEIMAYHHASTCQTMAAFRVGRKPPGPWTNLTPPIRGGVYHHVDTKELPDISDLEATPIPSDKDTSEIDVTLIPTAAPTVVGGHLEANSTCGRTGSDIDYPSTPSSTLRGRSPAGSPSPKSAARDAADSAVTDKIRLPSPSYPAAETQTPAQARLVRANTEKLMEKGEAPSIMSPDKFIDWAVQQDVDRGLRDYPPIEVEVQQDIVRRYRAMHQRVIDEGLYQCRYIEYGKEMTRYASLFAMFLVTLHYGWYFVSACFLGVFWHQIMFTAHDAGHRAITQNFVADTMIGIFIADFCCGLSIGWWKSSHNVHHIITNHPEHDPDIQNVPLFAISPSFFKSIVSSYYDGFVFAWDAACDFLVPYQQYAYYPIMAVARFNLYVLSWLHVLGNKSSGLGGSKAWWIRPMELVGMACYWFLFGYCLVWCSIPTWTSRVIFVLTSHIVLMPLHVQINLSHWGMSTSDLGEGESFPQRQMRTTMDVDCPTWLDWFHGGLQFQTVHHLFPRAPRHNLRKIQTLVREFSEDTKVPYSILTFIGSNRKVLGRLGEVGEQVRILAACQKHLAETNEMGFH